MRSSFPLTCPWIAAIQRNLSLSSISNICPWELKVKWLIVSHCHCFLLLQFSYNLWLTILWVCSTRSEIDMWGSYCQWNLTGHKTSLQDQATVRIRLSLCIHIWTEGLKEISELKTLKYFFSSFLEEISVWNNTCYEKCCSWKVFNVLNKSEVQGGLPDVVNSR